MPVPSVDGLPTRAKPTLDFCKVTTTIAVEFARQGGKGQFAAVEAVVSPARVFALWSAEAAWATPADQAEFEIHLLQGALVELMPQRGAHLLGVNIKVVAAKTDVVRSSAMAFFQVGRLLALRLMALNGSSDEPCRKDKL
jgi:hypothetical protein